MRLEFLQEIYEQSGPFATVYLDTSGDAEDANKARQLRWRSACEHLTNQGASEETIEALSHAIGDDTFQQPQAGRKGQVLVAAHGTVLFTDELEDPPTQFPSDQQATFSAIPHLMPYLRTRSSRAPHLLVMIDRHGAEITAVGNTLKERTRTVEGDDNNPLRKSSEVARGDHEESHFSAVEEQWKSNADSIAKKVSRDATQYDVELIVLGGDPQMSSLLKDRLHKETEKLVVQTDASNRGANESNERLQDAIAEAVASVVQEQVQETVTKFEEKRGNNGGAAEGWQAIIGALQAGQIQTLLWGRTADSSDAQGTLSIGSEPNLLAADDDTVKEIGSEWVDHAPAEDAVLRALVGTGADVVFVDSDQVSLTDNVGAVLRFSTAMDDSS